MTMIEKVARAIHEARPPRYFSNGSLITWESMILNCHYGTLASLRRDARAAIEAMRPWGRELQERGNDWEGEVNFGGHLDMYSFSGCWEAGIDAALNEKAG